MSSEARYKILYEDYESSYIMKISFAKCAWGTVFLPFSAFIFCICYSVLFNFEKATFTHCNVYNFLPSISAAIGSYSPQKEIWQIAIYLHFLPRLCIAFVYFQYNSDILQQETLVFRVIALIFNITENVALVTLSYWTSSVNYAVHKVSFVMFILVSQMYMLLTWILHTNCRKTQKHTYTINRSIQWKKRLIFINLSAMLAAIYCFRRHNEFCEPYVYTAFAFFEYIVVLTNMGFHLTAFIDFGQRDLVLHSHGISLVTR